MKTQLILIEDNPADVVLFEEALARCPIDADIKHYADGADAAHDAERTTAPWQGASAILLDLNMPRVSGLDVLSVIRGNPALAHKPVAIITSSQSPKDVAEATARGATCYVRKPTDLRSFFCVVCDTVQDLLALSDEADTGIGLA